MLTSSNLHRPILAGSILAITAVALAACTSATSTTSSTSSTSSAQPSLSAAPPTTYSTVRFSQPFSVSVDPLLGRAPAEDSTGLVTWTERTKDKNRIRVLVPAKYYDAEEGPAKPPPTDYSSYLASLTSKGVVLTNPSIVEVDGHQVRVVTADAADGVDGSIGCASASTPQNDLDHCFAFGPDFSIRIAVMKNEGHTVIAWARSDPNRTDTEFNSLFERMLTSIKFR